MMTLPHLLAQCVSESSTLNSILVSYFPWFTILSCHVCTAPMVPAQSVAPFAWATSSSPALAEASGWRWGERERDIYTYGISICQIKICLYNIHTSTCEFIYIYI